MPGRPGRQCRHPGCGVLVFDGSNRCEKHPATAWAKQPDAPKRITGRRLQAMRKSLFERQPLCEPCNAKGIVRLATIRDHRIPLAEGGADDASNEQAICEACHAEKTHAESLRGIARSRGGRVCYTSADTGNQALHPILASAKLKV